MVANADRVNATLADNDETERFALSPGLWLMARSQASLIAGDSLQVQSLIPKTKTEGTYD